MSKKFIPLLISTLPIFCLCSCSGDSSKKIVLAKNSDEIYSQSEHTYRAIDLEEISANHKLGVGFAIYLSTEGCSECLNFTPIMESYLQSTNLLTYHFDIDNNLNELRELNKIYNHQLFTYSENDSIYVTAPSVYLVNGDNINKVSNDSYMKTKAAFNNYLNGRYQVKDVYTFKGKIDCPTNYVNVTFNYDHADLLSLFTNLVLPAFKESTNKIIVSNNPDSDALTITKDGQNYPINSETDPSLIKSLL